MRGHGAGHTPSTSLNPAFPDVPVQGPDVGTSLSIFPFPGRDEQLSRLSLLETKLIAGRASPSHNPGHGLGRGFSKIGLVPL